MSWPTDGLPRFKVGSVHGFTIGGHYETGGSAREVTLWNVMERAHCHEEVWRQSAKARGRKSTETYARELAARLEAEHAS